MRRREFFIFLGSTATWPLAARAQSSDRLRRVALLMGFPEGDAEGRACASALQRRLEELGWQDGRNIKIETRWAGGDPGKARTFAKELVAMAPDVIVPNSNMVTTVLRHETRTIPIVFVFVGDPVGSGFVASLAKPGANLTGFALFEPAIGGKWLQVLAEIAPDIKHVAFLLHRETPANVNMLNAAEAAAPALGVKLSPFGIQTPLEIERAITEFASTSNGGLVVAPNAHALENRDTIIGLAPHYRLPAVYGFRSFATSGGLVSYGTSPIDQFRQGASYVDLILKGAKAADLPVQFPTKYELVVNHKTARALGLKVSEAFLQRADEVIE
jgi:putative tryptophan/tyrosine transport system substrate-binding protein